MSDKWNDLIYESRLAILEDLDADVSLSDGEKYIRLLNVTEGVTDEIKQGALYVKNLILKVLARLGVIPKKTLAIKELTNEYNLILADYNKLKSIPGGDEELANSIRTRLANLRAKLERINTSSISSIDHDEPSSSVKDFDKSSGQIYKSDNKDTPERRSIEKKSSSTSTTQSTYRGVRGTKSVGDTTTSVENQSLEIWRKHWKGKCVPSFTGKKLRQCKAKGVDMAISFVRSKMYLCNQTVDPDGCKETLTHLIEFWVDRKKKYLRYR